MSLDLHIPPNAEWTHVFLMKTLMHQSTKSLTTSPSKCLCESPNYTRGCIKKLRLMPAILVIWDFDVHNIFDVHSIVDVHNIVDVHQQGKRRLKLNFS